MNQPAQQQQYPGTEAPLEPRADHGEESYRGAGRLEGKVAVVTGADSGIGKAAAIASTASRPAPSGRRSSLRPFPASTSRASGIRSR